VIASTTTRDSEQNAEQINCSRRHFVLMMIEYSDIISVIGD